MKVYVRAISESYEIFDFYTPLLRIFTSLDLLYRSKPNHETDWTICVFQRGTGYRNNNTVKTVADVMGGG